MYLAPYFLPTLAKAVWVWLGDERMGEYEAAAQIYQQLLIAYLKQDLRALTLSKSW